MEPLYSYSTRYCDYLLNRYPDMDTGVLRSVEAIAENTNWDRPVSSLDWNNLAVVTLIEAEQSEDLQVRGKYINKAVEILEQGFALDGNPLCAAHYAFIQSATDQKAKALNVALNELLKLLQPIYTSNTITSPGLIYFPPSAARVSADICFALQLENGYTQALTIFSEVLWRSQLVFYNHLGMRFLELATRLFPNSLATVHLRLGITNLMQDKVEGLLNLHLARQIDPNNASILQALYLGYAKIGDLKTANYWLETARNNHLNRDNAAWQWSRSPIDPTGDTMTYVCFEQDLVMAVAPSFSSMVTSVLVSEGDWFEREMEFWRYWVQPGMTVIDVGANAGVYTFSAARRVGSSGLVLAVEPFSKCVKYLQETCRVNQMNWVRVCAGAASDRNSTAKLAINSASELNEIIIEGTVADRTNENFEEVTCFTLDSLIEKEGVNRVDLLKIDAEGHEIQVLMGSDRILTEYRPTILYENIASTSASNQTVADFLRSIGYKLYLYRSYVRQLVPIGSNKDLEGNLNIIAIHHQTQFSS